MHNYPVLIFVYALAWFTLACFVGLFTTLRRANLMWGSLFLGFLTFIIHMLVLYLKGEFHV